MSFITLQLPNLLLVNYYYQQVNYKIYFSKYYLDLLFYNMFKIYNKYLSLQYDYKLILILFSSSEWTFKVEEKVQPMTIEIIRPQPINIVSYKITIKK